MEFARKYGLAVQLAYYPPYHSKYNPIERCWGILEMHWNGSLLDSIEAVVGFARSMTWKGKHPRGQRGGDDLRHGGEAEAGGDEGVGVRGHPPALAGEVVRGDPGNGAGRLTSFKSLRDLRSDPEAPGLHNISRNRVSNRRSITGSLPRNACDGREYRKIPL